MQSKFREGVFTPFSYSSSKCEDDLERNATHHSSMTPCCNIILALHADVTLPHRTTLPCTPQSNLNNNSAIYKRMTTNLTSGIAFRQIFYTNILFSQKPGSGSRYGFNKAGSTKLKKTVQHAGMANRFICYEIFPSR